MQSSSSVELRDILFSLYMLKLEVVSDTTFQQIRPPSSVTPNQPRFHTQEKHFATTTTPVSNSSV